MIIADAATVAAYTIVVLGFVNVLAYAVSGWRRNGTARAVRFSEMLAMAWLAIIFGLMLVGDRGNVVALGPAMILLTRSAIAALLLLSLARLRMD